MKSTENSHGFPSGINSQTIKKIVINLFGTIIIAAAIAFGIGAIIHSTTIGILAFAIASLAIASHLLIRIPSVGIGTIFGIAIGISIGLIAWPAAGNQAISGISSKRAIIPSTDGPPIRPVKRI